MQDQNKSCESCEQKNCSAEEKQKNESDLECEKRQKLASKLCKIKKKIIVLSGKGGVGKSTISANFAVALSLKGKITGLFDVDLHGPSIPGILGMKKVKIRMNQSSGEIIPPQVNSRLKVLSLGFLLESERDAIIWRGPMKYSAIRQLLEQTNWGELDFLVVDCHPGTGDESLSVIQLLGENSFAVVVTTPQSVATDDVRRSIEFCNELALPVVGLIENMSGCICPQCGKEIPLFGSGGGEKLAIEMDIPFLGRIPFKHDIVMSGDSGVPFVQNICGTKDELCCFEKIIDKFI
ncbi:MAG TPA: Mrp/NBP35 family ATP-binding protein [Victivallales bacterium]|nr:Mrp/NBP35 family ATP-binding protein [Victivallales bacterium]HRR27768.1 Mrp/NBP35 family ATP-binding protein [Victivallales bacterium]HRU01539.1 Mrp/NBP35 family ATP-binding protein [Victivallales bacterium]